MKKLITLLLVLTGCVMSASAWTGTVRGSFNGWSDSANPFTAIGNWEMVAKLDGKIIHDGDITFKPFIDGKGYRGPSSDYTLPTDASGYYGTESTGGTNNFIIKQNANATDIYVHVKTYDDGSNNWWEVKVLVVEKYTSYPIKFSSTWGSVNAYIYYNGVPLEGAWPGKSLTTTSGSCSASLSALPGSKVIFNDSSNKTDDLDLVRNGVYSKASGLSAITVSISSVGFATFSSEKAVDFTGKGVDAYIASVSDGKVKLTKHNKVPAYNGVLLKGTAGSYEIPVTASPTDIDSNNLMATVTETNVAASTDGAYHYFLSGTDASTVGFYNLDADKTSGAGKAYLETTTALASNSAGSRVTWVFDDDETTGIAAVEKTDNTDVENKVVYNLNGQRVMNPTKGLYIVNGKKVIIK